MSESLDNPAGGRAFNFSSASVAVYANGTWYRLAAGCSTPVGFDVEFVRALDPSMTIRGAACWSLGGSVAHVVDLPRPEPMDSFSHAHSKDIPVRVIGLYCAPAPASSPTYRGVKSKDNLDLIPARPWVTILGAGIAGLSAAHELVERGFEVQIIEKSHGAPKADASGGSVDPERFSGGLNAPDIGGIARTQWATAPLMRYRGQDSTLKSIRRQTRRDASGKAQDWSIANQGSLLNAKSERTFVEQRKESALDETEMVDAAVEGETEAQKSGAGEAGRFDAMRVKSVHGDAVWYGSDAAGWLNQKSFFRVPFGSGNIVCENESAAGLLETKLREWLEHLSQTAPVAALQLVMVVYRSKPSSASPYGPAAAYERVKNFLKWAKKKHVLPKYVEAFPVARMDVEESPTETFTGLIIRHHDHLGLIAGEHGFRFFPGFYRHLRDTMLRTPIYDTVEGRFTNQTVHDNLTQVFYQSIEDPTRRRGTAFLRKGFKTLGELINQYYELRTDLGYRPADMLRFILRITRYVTSSSKRREIHYEKLPWWDFLSLRDLRRAGDPDRAVDRLPYGERFARAIKNSPEALVAMKSEVADARTQGNITVQLAMDQFNLHEYTDSTLNGPTSESWFRHWREYLEKQGVRFFVGEVTSITAGGKEKSAKVQVAFPETDSQNRRPAGFFDPNDDGAQESHYYLSALDAVSLARVVDLPGCGVADQVKKLTSSTQPDPTALPKPLIPENLAETQDERVQFQTLSGIQLYYLPRTSFEPAHIYYADAAWGLSAISQIQYWGPVATGGAQSKLLGNLSIDIGAWRPRKKTESLAEAKNPNTLTDFEIAQEVFTQIMRNRPADGPTPAYYHIDDYITFAWDDGSKKILPKWNRSPFLINVADGWRLRPPGEPWSPADPTLERRVPGDGGTPQGKAPFVWRHRLGGYEVYYGNLVFAGTHMRTFTRLGTMESANESARHAVNAILDHLTSKACKIAIDPDRDTRRHAKDDTTNPLRLSTPFGDYCDIWDPEHNEFDDVDYLRDIDRYLVEYSRADPRTADDVPEGQLTPSVPPHLFDILGIDRLPDLIDTDEDSRRVLKRIWDGLEKLKTVVGRFDINNLQLTELRTYIDNYKKA